MRARRCRSENSYWLMQFVDDVGQDDAQLGELLRAGDMQAPARVVQRTHSFQDVLDGTERVPINLQPPLLHLSLESFTVRHPLSPRVRTYGQVVQNGHRLAVESRSLGVTEHVIRPLWKAL